MTINMLIFDYKEHEKSFFKNNKIEGFNITFFEENLNENTVQNISQETKDKTTVISVSPNSDINKKVINHFKNLRIISTRSNKHEHICKKSTAERNIAVFNVEFCDDENLEKNSHEILKATFDQIRDAHKGNHIYGIL